MRRCNTGIHLQAEDLDRLRLLFVLQREDKPMRTSNRIFPLFLCFVLVLSMAAFASPAHAAEDYSPSLQAEEIEGAVGGGGDIPASTGMFDTTASLGKTLMDGIWSLFGIYVPGFSFTFGQMWIGVLLCSVSILVIRMIFGFGGSGSGGISSRTSSTNRPRISKERRHDQF